MATPLAAWTPCAGHWGRASHPLGLSLSSHKRGRIVSYTCLVLQKGFIMMMMVVVVIAVY